MNYKFYLVEKKAPIAWVFLNRPEKKNAMNLPAWKEIIPLFQELCDDTDIRVIILAAKGKNFSTGLDMVEMLYEIPELLDKEQKAGVKIKILKKIKEMQETMSCIEKCRKPVIAAIHGYCYGAGLEMAVACDIRLCSSDALFSIKETAVGFVADVGVLQRMPNIIGQGFTRELAFTAKTIEAQQAKEINLVNKVYVSYEQLLVEAEKLALEIASNPPYAVQATKDVLNYSVGKTVEDGLRYVASVSTSIAPSDDLLNSLSAFNNKRNEQIKRGN